MRPVALAVLLALVSVALAGCGDDGGTQEIEVAPGFTVTAEPPKPGNGNVAGIVGDDAIYPLEGVLLKLVGTELNTTSDSSGRFAIVNVPPGIYILEGNKKDHAMTQTTVDVQPDKTAKAVLLLTRIPKTDPFHLTFQHEGHVGVWASSQAVNTDKNVTFGFTLEPSSARTIVLESTWDMTTVETGNRPPLYYQIEDPGGRIATSDEVPNPFSLHLDAGVLTPGHVTFEVTIQPNQPEPFLVYQGRGQDFVTIFYNEPAPADWSILTGST